MATTYIPHGGKTTGANLAGQIDPAKLWQKLIDKFEENADFYQQMEGSGSHPIVTKTDLSKGVGQKMTIRVQSGFYDEPHYGDDVFDDEDDFEENLYEDYDLDVDVIRHATSATERAEELMGLRGEIFSSLPQKLGDWLGRLKTENLDMMFLHKVNAENFMHPNGRTFAGLGADDGLNFNFVVTAASALQRQGGTKATVGKYTTGKHAGRAARGYVLIASTDALTVLKNDTAYQTIVQNAGSRGAVNYIFTGEVADMQGVKVIEREVIDHDGEGAIGSPLNPRARLGNAITAGTTAFDITGGGNPTSAAKTKKKYFKYFPGYAYKFSDGSVVTPPGGTTHYCLIINPPNAPTDPNKIGMYAYTTGNDGNKITVTARLASSAGGIAVTTLGAVTWSTGVWAGKHTDVHPAGALVVPCNANGEPIGHSFLLGNGAALRGYGKFRNKRGEEKEEDGFIRKVFIRSYFGQTPRKNRNGQCPGIMVLTHALHYQDLPLPKTVGA